MWRVRGCQPVPGSPGVGTMLLQPQARCRVRVAIPILSLWEARPTARRGCASTREHRSRSRTACEDPPGGEGGRPPGGCGGEAFPVTHAAGNSLMTGIFLLLGLCAASH